MATTIKTDDMIDIFTYCRTLNEGTIETHQIHGAITHGHVLRPLRLRICQPGLNYRRVIIPDNSIKIQRKTFLHQGNAKRQGEEGEKRY